MESKLVISSIWEDESLFEVKVFGSNGNFSGEAACYTNRENILELAEILEVFPQKLSDSFDFSTGKSYEISYFSISGFCTDGSGHTILAIEIAHIVSFTNSRTQNYKASFDFRAEPEGINQFGRQLRKVASEQLGKTKAVLNYAT
jgi:hypothetical protein